MQIASYAKKERANRLKSPIRKTPAEFAFIKIQLKRILSINEIKSDPKDWVSSSIEKFDYFCVEMMIKHKNIDRRSIADSIRQILSIYINEKTQDKENERKRSRKQDNLLYPQLSSRMQEIARYSKTLKSTRGPDRQLSSICELLHLCRWGLTNRPISSSKKTASSLSVESGFQKKEILFKIVKLLKDFGLYKKKSIETMSYSVNKAYGNWNAYSVLGYPASDKPIYSSRLNWIPNR